MKTINLPKIMAIVLLSVFPIVMIMLILFGGNRLLSICAVAALPEGVLCYISNYNTNDLKFDGFYNKDPVVESSDNVDMFISDIGVAKTVSVQEAVMGNIIKKTLSPYSAKYKYNNIYLSNSTGTDINIADELSKPLDFSVTKSSEPQVLIYHTHTTESYMQSEEPRTTDETKNMVAVGEVVKQRLEAAGYTVIHDKTIHDYPGFSGSYSRSAETVKANLEKYPSIKVTATDSTATLGFNPKSESATGANSALFYIEGRTGGRGQW